MKKYIFIFSFILVFTSFSFSQVNFDDYFISKTLRLDYTQAGDAQNSNLFFEQMKCEPYWGGNVKNLIDKFNFGEYRFLVYDSSSQKLIYSRGFSTLFQEWQTSDEAKVLSRSFYETIVFPFPKKTVKVEIHRRNRDGNLEKKFELYVNPKDYFIREEAPPKFEYKKVLDSGDPKSKVDIVIIPDGYAKEDMEKFNSDIQRFIGYFFACSPYKENKNNFNIWAINAISQESGTDIPGKLIYKNTILSASFYTFNTERYLMTNDIKSVRDIAGLVPYDQIMILVNSPIYGGGGVYNYYSLVSSDDDYSDYVMCHEFGHAFADLADEYWTSDVAVNDYFNLNVEPVQPNITTLVNFESKWKKLVDKNMPIPTPNEKKYYSKVGAFEGGGYVEKGIYRPMYDCTMKSRSRDNFCPVCKNTIADMIKFYCDK
ncbi:MAG: M64 family metallo-endopeptidase [Ignavibacteriae bacterium]|nr:M64 family metallo-endopeptidase [Ignavibacteriota bacterium]